MAWNIYPTNTPVGSWQGQSCEEQQEFQHAALFNLLHQSPLHSFRCSGGVFTQGSGLSVDIPTGTYVIDGQIAYNDNSENLASLTDDATNYIFARLLKTGDLVTSAEYYANTTGALPSEPHVLIGKIVFASGTGTVTMSQATPNVVTGTTTYGTSVFLGFEPKAVLVERTGVGATYLSSVVATITDFGFTTPAGGYAAAYIAYA